MKKILPLLAMLGLLASPTLAQDAKPAAINDAERAKIETVVKDLLVREPELIIQAAQRMQQREMEKQTAAAASGIKDNKKELLEDKNSPAAGASVKEADITIVEFFDYNCGYCKKVHPTTEQLIKEDKKIRLVYKQFPILGPTSLTGAQYAVAAGKQGKFLEFNEKLITLQDHVSEAALDKIATDLKLDLPKLKKDAASAETKAKIDADLELGRKVGVQGTPGFIIGDKLYPGAMELAMFKQIVAEARTKK